MVSNTQVHRRRYASACNAWLGHATNTAYNGHNTKLGRQAERLIQSRAKPGGKVRDD